MHAWLIDEAALAEQGRKSLAQQTPNVPVSGEALVELGVLHWHFDPATEMSKVDALRKERSYSSGDEVNITPAGIPKEKHEQFFQEHLHDDEEIRYMLEGSGFFDVRDRQDRWVRIHLTRGDLIILPAGIYHRFTLDVSDFVHVMRLFKDEPVWTAISRPADDRAVRKAYLQSLKV
ncbi:hypothetical protein CAOG_03129 [Capsaspora owczarzaki ATCC 30864]|uniref:Acireductone dioxygenase n=1 Tax=Capsaspora owczarzaki (strain ATCC 30864) TaxID=595528 RepID=A0A0D2VP15_CAPO3|nr:hypothetical protein CAOG_03129 [Capsaspora owczarzaki ATCC 30864]KJE92107.1 hypothetical protein CAOG_003129 [Capsaspora owczarzaki ATCC 30864]|eukprot:XP_004363968.1 hypothetical protein CAOG_03129 [Capsaspora owczarzaki ATCC 30864]